MVNNTVISEPELTVSRRLVYIIHVLRIADSILIGMGANKQGSGSVDTT